MYTQLGVLSKGTVIECNVRYALTLSSMSMSIVIPSHPIVDDKPHLTFNPTSELGMVTAGGKVIWGRYAQITVRSPLLPTQTQQSPMLTSRPIQNNCEMDGCVNAVLLV